MFHELDPDTQRPEEERRRDDRSRLIIELYFAGAGATGVASTRDISAGGLYMNTLAVLPEGATVLLRIPLGATRLVVEARVVYSNPGRGVGVHFDGLSEEARAIIESNSGPMRRLVA